MQIHTFDDHFKKCTFIKDIGHSMTMNLKPLESQLLIQISKQLKYKNNNME
jgi:hypothetical protein